MASRRWFQQAAALPGSPGLRGLTVTADDWRQAARDLAAGSAQLVTMWADEDALAGRVVRAAFLAEPGLLVLSLPVPGSAGPYPGLEGDFPAASRLQRALRDLSGPASTDPDTRPWLRHAAWPAGFVPLAAGPDPGPA